MKAINASADTFVEALDNKITTFLHKNKTAIIKEYREKAGRGVPDNEVNQFLSELGDRIYESITLDPAQLDRFINFYANDDKLQKFVSESIDSLNVYPRAAASPEKISGLLKAMATQINQSATSNKLKLANNIKTILNSII
jgi:hypothetical protein